MLNKAKSLPAKHFWDIWIALFAIASISTISMRLWATDWTSDLYILIYLMFFAGITGLALGASHFSLLVSILFSTCYGIFTIGWLFGATVTVEMSWRERILNYLSWRLRNAISQFIAGETVSDPILFLTIMALLFWILGTAVTFTLMRRGNVWSLILPLGFALLMISHYDQDLTRNTNYLMSFLFFTLLLIGRMTFLQSRREWQQEGIHTTTGTHLDLSKSLLLLAAFLLALAWLIPVTSRPVMQRSELWETITEPWERFTDQLSDLFVADTSTSPLSTTYYGDSIGLGTGSPTSETLVLTIEVETDPPSGYRHYWRARSYDYFEDSDWSSSSDLLDTYLFPETFNLQYPAWEGKQPAAYAFTAEADVMINLYSVGETTWVSRPVEAITLSLPDSKQDLIALTADPEVSEGETYQVETLVSLPTETELRQTGTDYPEWLDRYLQLPEGFSSDIAALAAEIVEGTDNPYDQAYAITRYLRANIEYSQTISSVPSGEDPVEWFLFDEQMGFCNYYATAEVLMLRSLGIPARLAVGYAEGEYDERTNTYTVLERDSHAWPEVYFIDYGWVIFEPTTAQPALILPRGLSSASEEDTESQELDSDIPLMDDEVLEEETPEVNPDESTLPDEGSSRHIEGIRIIWFILGIFLVGVLVTVIILIRPTYFKINIQPLPILLENALHKRGKPIPKWLQHWSYNAQMSPAEKAYRQLCRSIRFMGHPLNPADTPTERAQGLMALIPESEKPIQDIIYEYNLDKFSHHITNEKRAQTASRKVRGLALKARMNRLFSFGKQKD